MTKKYPQVILVYAAVFAVVGLAALVWRGPQLYRVTVLASPGEYVVPCAINDRGQVVGYVQTGEGETRLFLWERHKGMQDLGPVVSGSLDINNAGQIVGAMIDPNGREQAFLRDPNSGRQLLGKLGGIHTEATAINDSGQVVGTVEISNGARHAFLWDRARGLRDIGEGYMPVINDAGQIIPVATSDVLIDANTGTDTRIPIFGPGFRSINNHGCVIGYHRVSGAGPQFAMWHSGLQILRPMPVDREPRGYVINDANQVLFAEEKPAKFRIWGRVLRPHQIKCYLLDPTRGVISLGRYAHGGSDEFLYPVDLSNKGDILLVCRYKGIHSYKAVLLEPIPKRWRK